MSVDKETYGRGGGRVRDHRERRGVGGGGQREGEFGSTKTVLWIADVRSSPGVQIIYLLRPWSYPRNGAVAP